MGMAVSLLPSFPRQWGSGNAGRQQSGMALPFRIPAGVGRGLRGRGGPFPFILNIVEG